MYTKLVPETVNYIDLTSKFIWYHSFYHLSHLFAIIFYKSILYSDIQYFLQFEHHIDEQLLL